MNKKISFVMGVLCMFLVASCGSRGSKTIEYAEDLTKKTQEFRDKVDGVSSSVVASTKELDDQMAGAAGSASDMTAVADKFKDDWESSQREVNYLEEALAALTMSCEALLSELDKQADGIRDEELKRKDKAKTAFVRDEYNSLRIQAERDISEVRSLLVKGNDYVITMKNDAARGIVSAKVKEFAQISSKSKEILARLNRLAEKAEAIANS